jgi:hypothetical protein
LVVFGDVDALHRNRHAKHLGFKRQAKVVLEHGVESRRLFRFAVRVHERFFDKLIEPRLAQARPPFARRDLSLAISVHARLLS